MNKKFDGIILPENWFWRFDLKKLYKNELSTNVNRSHNFIKIKLANLLNNEITLLSLTNFFMKQVKHLFNNHGKNDEFLRMLL